MALQYGVNITASDMRNILEQNDKQQSGVRSWRQLFGNASLGYEGQADAFKSYYSDAMAQAYKSNFAKQNAIMGAGLNVGATREMVAANRQDLQGAYDTYIKNYASNMQKAATGYNNEVGAIDEALTERATNFASLYDSAYKYLSNELYGSTIATQGNQPAQNNYLRDNGLDWLVTTGADGMDSLKSWNDIKTLMMNGDGSLNSKGVSFFDKMFNARPEQYVKETGDKVRTFDEWLSAEDNELRNWLGSKDAFNHTFAGTNLGTANTLTGRESTDMVGEDYEYITEEGMDDFNKDFGASLKSAATALSDAKKRAEELNALRTSQQKELERQIKEHAGDNYWRNYTIPTTQTADVDYGKARTGWTNYLKETNDAVANVNSFFKSKVGGKLYNEFMNEQKDLINEYKTYMEQATKSLYYDEAIANNMTKLYNRLLTNMRAYIKRHGYNKKTSGF